MNRFLCTLYTERRMIKRVKKAQLIYTNPSKTTLVSTSFLLYMQLRTIPRAHFIKLYNLVSEHFIIAQCRDNAHFTNLAFFLLAWLTDIVHRDQKLKLCIINQKRRESNSSILLNSVLCVLKCLIICSAFNCALFKYLSFINCSLNPCGLFKYSTLSVQQ